MRYADGERDPWDLSQEELVEGGGLTSSEMCEAERRFENGFVRYTNRGAVRQGRS